MTRKDAKKKRERLADNERFGAYLRERREAAGLSLRGLAGKLDVQPAYLSEVERGDVSVSERIANKALQKGLICRPLGQAIVLGPPFIITEAQIDEMFDILRETMAEVFADVGL